MEKNQNALPAKAGETKKLIKALAGDTADLNITELDNKGSSLLVISAEGMAGSLLINEILSAPLSEIISDESIKGGEQTVSCLFEKLLICADKAYVTTIDELMTRLFSGFCIIVCDGCSKAIAAGTQGFASRSVSLPIADQSVYGPQEGFTESIRVNISAIRRRMKTPKLRFELIQTGGLSKTDTAICYIEGRADRKAISKIRREINGIKLDTVLSCGYIRPFVEKGYSLTLFSPSRLTERPDSVCAALNVGRIAILTDGTPFAIIIPAFFSEHFITPDDYVQKPLYVAFIRVLKFFAFFLATLFPGIYAASVFEPEGFAFKLLLNLYSAEESSQFPLGTEVLIVTVLLEILREAGIRLPKAVGSAVSIVGGLIIGDAAVKCGIISAPLLILVGLTATSSFVIPEISAQTSIIRFIFIIAGSFAGMTGLACALAMVTANVCAMDELSAIYTSPIIPVDIQRIKNVLMRKSFKTLQKSKTKADDKGAEGL